MFKERRIELHNILKSILGNNNVYYQPPENIKIKYPAIVYNRNSIKMKYADNVGYKIDNSYTVTVIYTDPDSELPNKIATLEGCVHNRFFTSDGLYHSVYTIYY